MKRDGSIPELYPFFFSRLLGVFLQGESPCRVRPNRATDVKNSP